MKAVVVAVVSLGLQANADAQVFKAATELVTVRGARLLHRARFWKSWPNG